MLLLEAIIFLCVFSFTKSERNFFLGHRNGDNILPPEPTLISLQGVETKYFDQRLDHFNPTDTRTFQQRYFENTDFYNESSNNFFIMIGGESSASIGWMRTGEWYRLASIHNAVMFQLEHRYYGVSHPFSDTSTENLRYLTSQQAIEDLAVFITQKNQEYNLTSAEAKWIAFGGSYAGSMAAWVRQKYPHLVKGAMAASGPLLAILDFYEYYEVVSRSLLLHSNECVTSLETAIKQLDDLFTNRNIATIDSLFNICYGGTAAVIDDSKNVSTFFQMIAEIFAYVVQYHGIISSSFHTYCDILVDNSTGRTEVERLSDLTKYLYGASCFNVLYSSAVDTWTNLEVSEDSMMRQWLYQTCVEYGFYQTSSRETDVFGTRFPVDFYTDLCVDLFGSNFNTTLIQSGIDYTNIYYGELNIDASNVVHVHGKIDPWHALGIYETRDERSPAILINDTSHCANMYTYSESDSDELKYAKKEIERLVNIWLNGEEKETEEEGNSTAQNMFSSALLVMFCVFILIV